MILITFIILVLLNLNPINEFIRRNIEIYGYPAIFVFSLISNSFDQPIGPDSIASIGLFFGLNLLLVFIFSVLGTWTMDIIGFNLGRRVFSKRIRASCSAKQHLKQCKLFFKYGKFALLIGALTPVPEVFMIWLSGAFGMKFKYFFVFGMLPKAFRIGIVLLGIHLIFF